jgi:predicted transcriptional regulator
MESQNRDDLVHLAADIVAAYVTHNKIESSAISKLIEDVHTALVRAPAAATPEQKPLVPAVPIRKSVTPDYIISLEDGRKFKSLKRHLQGTYGMTPDEYRAKWGLPRDYPMVAPNYARARSDLAKKMGLGRKAAPAKAGPKGATRARKPRAAASK